MDFFLEDEGPNACCQPFADDAFNGKADYPTATWKRMFVTNPAITYVELNNVKDSRTYFVWNKYIGDECGIMIGQLPEYLGKHQFGWILKPRCQCAANRDWSD